MKKEILIFILLFCYLEGFTQASIKYKICIVAFYNLENLYDTTNNLLVNDDDFTMSGVKKYSDKIYRDKLDRLTKVIAEIGTDQSKDGASILGVAEIENDTVLNDLIHHPSIKKRNYQFVHFDSKDARGIDVALLYNPNYFKVESSKQIAVTLTNSRSAKMATRDILSVKGLLDGEPVYILVNHWPSKRGGEDLTAVSRNTAALVCRTEVDQILQIDPFAKIIVMGDLNDEPTSYAVQEILKAKGHRAEMQKGELYNPWSALYEKGYGSLANQDSWSLFDQIILTGNWLDKSQGGFFFYQQAIFTKNYMIENRGRYKGYPLRTWDGNVYRGGYSDHFPTYLIMLKNLH